MKPQQFAVKVLEETAVLIAGAFLAAWLIGQAPAARAWMERQWRGAKPPSPF